MAGKEIVPFTSEPNKEKHPDSMEQYFTEVLQEETHSATRALPETPLSVMKKREPRGARGWSADHPTSLLDPWYLRAFLLT
jgi:hypothetical protein